MDLLSPHQLLSVLTTRRWASDCEHKLDAALLIQTFLRWGLAVVHALSKLLLVPFALGHTNPLRPLPGTSLCVDGMRLDHEASLEQETIEYVWKCVNDLFSAVS